MTREGLAFMLRSEDEKSQAGQVCKASEVERPHYASGTEGAWPGEGEVGWLILAKSSGPRLRQAQLVPQECSGHKVDPGSGRPQVMGAQWLMAVWEGGGILT